MQINNKKIAVGLGLSILLILVLYLIFRPGPSPSDKSYEYVDKDTGETISVQPGVDPEQAGSEDEVTVIGLTALGNFGSAGLSNAQLPVFRKDLAEKGIKTIAGHEQIIKIVNPELNSETVKFETELIYKEGADKARLVFEIPDNFVFSYKIFIDGKVIYSSKQLVAESAVPPEAH